MLCVGDGYLTEMRCNVVIDRDRMVKSFVVFGEMSFRAHWLVDTRCSVPFLDLDLVVHLL